MRQTIGQFVWHGIFWAGALGLGCEVIEGLPELAPSPVGADAVRDAWVDEASPVGGDGATEFVSGALLETGLHSPSRAVGRPDPATPALAAAEAGRVYGLSAYAGLVITDASEGGPTRVEGRYPLVAAPFAISVRDGIVLALVNDDPALECLSSLTCQANQRGHVLLFDAREPSAPRLLAERFLPGAITHAHRIDDTLYTVSREFEPCGPAASCYGVPERGGAVTAISLADPLDLADLGQLEFPGDEPRTRSYSFAGARLYVATSQRDLRVVELERGVRLGPSVPIDGFPGEDAMLEQAGILQFQMLWPGDRELAYRVSAPGELEPIEPVVFSDLEGQRIWRPLFHGGAAFGLSQDGLTLLAFDLTARQAPRLAGTLALPFAATSLTGTRSGELCALGTGNGNRTEQESMSGPAHLARVDVQDITAPVLTGELSWSSNAYSSGQARYDAATGFLLAPYRMGQASHRVRVIATAGGEFALRADLENVYGAFSPDYVLDGGRVVSMRAGRLISYAIDGASSQTVPLSRPTDALRVLGERLVRFPGDAADVQLLALPIADPPMAEGAPLTGEFPRERLTSWRQRIFQNGQHLYLAGELGRASPELGIYGFDVSVPNATRPEGSATVPSAAADDPQPDVVQTSRTLVVAHRNVSATLGLDDPAPDVSLSYDIVDVSVPGAPRVAGHFDVPSALAALDFARWPSSTSIDTAWGWQQDSDGAPRVVDGDLLVTQHVERIDDSSRRYFLDRLDVSKPDAPVLLPAVNIPGSVLQFDADSGSLITIESLRFEERMDSAADCERVDWGLYNRARRSCTVTRQVLAGLSLVGNEAVRRSQLILDTERNAVSFAVSGPQVYYVTEALLSPDQLTAAIDSNAVDVPVTIERVRIDDGVLTRLPSLDVTGLHPSLPRYWQTLLARGNRVVAATAHDVAVIDFDVNPPSVRTAALPPWGCENLDLAGDQLYCARGPAGLAVISLAPSP